jgi:transposase
MATGTAYELFVGVDIAAKTFAAAWAQAGAEAGRATTFEQTPTGFTAFQQRLGADGTAPGATLIVMEATGTYWVALAVTLHQAGFGVSVINPGQIAQYARSLPRRGKTDALDAQVLARFARERQPICWTPPPQIYHELHQRLVARDGLLHMRTQAHNQRHALAQWPVLVAGVVVHLDGVIADLTARIAALEADIAQVLRDSTWAASALLLQGIPGIGLITSSWLLVGTLNFTLCPTPEQATAYVGLAPLPRESGTSIRGRAQIGHGGHARLRTALYLATLTAARYNPRIQPFYARLRAAGKPMKVARCAAARKLLHIAWAVVTKGQPFDGTMTEVAPAQAIGETHVATFLMEQVS